MRYFLGFLGSNFSQSANLSHSFAYLTEAVIVLDTYYTPMLIIYGVVTNLLSAIMLLRNRSCRGSHRYWPYIVGVSITDSIFLLSLLAVWLEMVFGFRLYSGDGWCQAITCLSSISAFLSLWYAVALSVDRFLFVFVPLKRNVLTTSARAKFVCLGLLWLAVPVYINMSIISGTVRISHDTTLCVKLRRFQSAMKILSKVDLILNVFVPYTGIILINIAIGFRLIKSFVVGQPTCEEERMKSGVELALNYDEKKKSPGVAGTCALANQTVVPLVVGLLFLALNLPAHSFETYVVISNLVRNGNGVQLSTYILQKTLMILWYSRMATTFLALVIFDQSFRRHLVAVLWWNRKNVLDAVTFEFPASDGTEEPSAETTTV